VQGARVKHFREKRLEDRRKVGIRVSHYARLGDEIIQAARGFRWVGSTIYKSASRNTRCILMSECREAWPPDNKTVNRLVYIRLRRRTVDEMVKSLQ
jgi:hypothetical protein